MRSYRTLSPLPAGPKAPAGGLLSVALSLGSPPPGVTRHRVSVEPGLSSPACAGAAVRPPETHLESRTYGLGRQGGDGFEKAHGFGIEDPVHPPRPEASLERPHEDREGGTVPLPAVADASQQTGRPQGIDGAW